jgi:putative ABC transport system permease protein
MEQTQDEARAMMRARRHLEPGQKDTFGILASSSLMDLWHNLTAALANGMVGIVSVFLLIGGIVIMNVMLASVTERTREIGVRKAIGARQSDILMQFLVEAVTMTSLGGAIGIFGAYLIAGLARLLTPFPMDVPMWSIIFSLVVSAVVGIFFGLYPARKAARLDPIEALRAET